MEKIFRYNWQVRDDWFTWCEDVPEEELLKTRIGGVGSILRTLFHIVDVEYGWLVLDLQGKQNREQPSFEDCSSLEKVKALSKQYHTEVEPFVTSWTSDMELRTFTELSPDGEVETFRYGEVMRHVIAHEIHHIGQLSIWSRQLGKKPVTANLIFRGLYE